MTNELKKAIEIIKAYLDMDSDVDSEYLNAQRTIIQALEQQRWIPVSERLPEDGQDVLICDIDEDVMMGHHVKGAPDTHFTQQGSYEVIKNILAWMPLPEEPYKAESEDKE